MIVPDFGGFMTHEVSARYDAEDRLFLPPLRTLGFNPQLRMNDSVLVQSYVEAYDISYPEALRRVEDEVKELKQRLGEEGEYTMDGLGTLTVNQEGNYEFAPCEAGILSPSLYGLSSFSFKQLKDEAPLTEQEGEAQTVALPQPTAEADAEETHEPTLLEFTDDDTTDDTLRIKMSWVRNAVAVAAAVVAFFLLSTPVVNSELGTRAMSQLQGNLIYKLMPQDTNIVPAEPVSNVVAVQSKATAKQAVRDTISKAAAVPAKAEATPVVANRYCIVVASQVKQSNAEIFVAQLHKQGYKDAKLYIHNNVVRVTCGEYQTEGEAYQQLNKLNGKEGFEEAWVYKKEAEV